ncbi:MAG: SET domain-containing protein [Acidobacteriota bacterium]|jgi:SET domain-containing protein|nr:SET domain-containing protein [Acidobacteriota bacterium]
MTLRLNAFNFQVKRSRIQGRGLYALSSIPARRKLGELGGELITRREARRRARHAQCIMIVETGEMTAVDASRGGNDFRYVNHSCSPNTFMRICWGRIEFYALRRIKPGEELTCDYGETHHDGALACRCHSLDCRGHI